MNWKNILNSITQGPTVDDVQCSDIDFGFEAYGFSVGQKVKFRIAKQNFFEAVKDSFKKHNGNAAEVEAEIKESIEFQCYVEAMKGFGLSFIDEQLALMSGLKTHNEREGITIEESMSLENVRTIIKALQNPEEAIRKDQNHGLMPSYF